LRSGHSDTRPACGLHTHELWESYTDPDGDSYSDGYSCSYGYGYGYSHRNANCDIYSTATLNSNTTASSHAAASPVSNGSGSVNYLYGDSRVKPRESLRAIATESIRVSAPKKLD
jgi:hypothetical protein